ncbi:MAG: PAS domain-containing protein [Chloroflexi bacterium]|nr:PAS domain-containing protein [Chloroflexota bacterium]
MATSRANKRQTGNATNPARARKESVKPEKDSLFSIIGMGASAGGLEAFEQFFTNMAPDPGMGFVVIPHLDPTHASMMADLLKRYTRMKVLQATDGIGVEPNSVYVIPPNKSMVLRDGRLQLLVPAELPAARRPIDVFLRSLAADRGSAAICIILSGTGSDGTLGLKAIKAELGMAMVQDLDSAKYDGMPRSAIDTGLADYILPPSKMPERLLEYVKNLQMGAAKVRKPSSARIADALARVFHLLLSHTGHDFSQYKRPTILRRIERRMSVNQIKNVTSYARFLDDSPEEANALFKDILISVTGFFRDGESFVALKDRMRPLLATRPSGSTVRAWVPGCATGEEAYSIAIIIRELMDEMNKEFTVQVFGTDIDEDAIAAARTGNYPSSAAIETGEADRLNRLFVKQDGPYRVRKDIREMVVFAVQDVLRDPPFSRLDLISCRNLLIYLDRELHRKLLPLFHYALNERGVLFLGPSETIGEFGDLFEVLDKKWKIFARKTPAQIGHPGLPPAMVLARQMPPSAARELEAPQRFDVTEIAEKVLLEKYAPPCVVIDGESNIVFVHGRTGKYLELASGQAKLDALSMAREGIRNELASAIRRARSERQDITYAGLQVKSNGGLQSLNLTVRPFVGVTGGRELFMVVFQDMPSPAETSKGKRVTSSEKDRHIAGQDKEIKLLKENYQLTIEELGTSNEELKSANEELQSALEELQSTNEELETSREELQSVNEELMTVNTELQASNDDLSRANDDMTNLLNTTGIATIFVDNGLSIRRFTPAATSLFNLIPTDVGRPLGHITSALDYGMLEKDAEAVLATLTPKEAEAQTRDGRWYRLRLMPYRTRENTIGGLVMTFIDEHAERQRARELSDLAAALDYERSVVDTLHEPFLVLDQDLRVLSANRAFYENFKTSPERTAGRLVFELGDGRWNIPALRKRLEEILSQDTSFEGFEVEQEFPPLGRRKMLLNARRIPFDGGQQRILLAMRDVGG